jgi:hypothetical protein
MLAKVRLLLTILGVGLAAVTINQLGACDDECHGFAIPALLAVILCLAGATTLLVAAIKWNLVRQLGGRNR